MMKSLSRPAVAAGLAVLCAVFALTEAADARPLRSSRSSGQAEVILEGSAVQPLGDLGADWTEPAGFGAGLGWDVGFRFRQRWPSGWAVSPSFHYVELGNHMTDDATEGLIDVGAKMYRYGIDVQYFFRSRYNAPQFYLTFGAALVRNKLRIDFLDTEEYYDEGRNSVAGAAGLGVRMGSFEITGEYNLNRIRTSELTNFFEGVDNYDWHYAVLEGRDRASQFLLIGKTRASFGPIHQQ